MTTQAISVQIRVRPHKSSDGAFSCSEGIILTPASASVRNGQENGARLRFGVDTVHGPESTQELVFETVKPIVEQVYKGINTTILAYGVTGSGKTWTMQGTKDDGGIIPRVVKSLFLKKSRLRKSSIRISFSYVEILIEEVYDLLSGLPDKKESHSSCSSSSSSSGKPGPTTDSASVSGSGSGSGSGSSGNAQANGRPKTGTDRKRLDIRTTPTGENVIAGLTRREVASVGEFESLYAQASQTRKTASTSLNSSSSRSHAILSLYVETIEGTAGATSVKGLSSQAQGQSQDQGKTFVGKICLVDLAGSEDNKLTGNDPVRMRESSAINRSLTNLGNVVEALNTGSGRVPYRDSKLTRILQDALGGTSIGMLICNLAPGEKFAKDTLRSLKFASRTREVENKVVVNERDDRPQPVPHFSRPAVRPAQAPAILLPSNMTASKQPVRPPTASLNSHASAPEAKPSNIETATNNAGMMNNVRSQIGVAGVSLTDDQLKSKIEDIVKQVMEQKEKAGAQMTSAVIPAKHMAEAGPSDPPRATKNSNKDVSGMPEEDRKARAKVLVNLGRQHQDEGNILDAIRYYNQAKVYIPDNKKLAIRIVELELALDGEVPLRQRAAAKAKKPAAVIEDDRQSASSLKRSSAPAQALADITNGFAPYVPQHGGKALATGPAKDARNLLPGKPHGASMKPSRFGVKVSSEDKENAMARPAGSAPTRPKRKVETFDHGHDTPTSDSGDDGDEEYMPERPAAKKPKRKLAVLTDRV